MDAGTILSNVVIPNATIARLISLSLGKIDIRRFLSICHELTGDIGQGQPLTTTELPIAHNHQSPPTAPFAASSKCSHA